MEIQDSIRDADGHHTFWVSVSGAPSDRTMRASLLIVFCEKSASFKRIRKHAELRWDFQKDGWWIQDKDSTSQKEIRILGQNSSLEQVIRNLQFERYPITRGAFVEIPKPGGDYPERKAELVLTQFLDKLRPQLEEADAKVVEWASQAHQMKQYSTSFRRLETQDFHVSVESDGSWYSIKRQVHKVSSTKAIYELSLKLTHPASVEEEPPLFRGSMKWKYTFQQTEKGLYAGKPPRWVSDEDVKNLEVPEKFFRTVNNYAGFLLLSNLLNSVSTDYLSSFTEGHKKAVKSMLRSIGRTEGKASSLIEASRIPRNIQRTSENSEILDRIFAYQADEYDLDYYEKIYPTAASRIWKLYKKMKNHFDWLSKNNMPPREAPNSELLLKRSYNSHTELSRTLNTLVKRW